MASKISRYTTAHGPEAEFQPGSQRRVLRNHLGITTKTGMDRAEFDALLGVQESYLKKITPKTRFTVALIRQMHRDWLGKIYPWAGEYRSVELQKGDFRWPPAQRIAANMATFERECLARLTPCFRTTLPQVASHIAVIHAELLLIHPFREGNGRLARWLADLLSLQAGFPLPSYRLSGPGSKPRQQQYLNAVKSGYQQDYARLTAFFVEAITRGREESGG